MTLSKDYGKNPYIQDILNSMSIPRNCCLLSFMNLYLKYVWPQQCELKYISEKKFSLEWSLDKDASSQRREPHRISPAREIV